MDTTPAPPGTRITRSWRGQHRVGPVAAGLASLVLVAAAGLGCSAGHGTAGTGSGGSQTFTGGGTFSQGQSTAGSYTLAFARCMRAHGVPKFPDPGGPIGPGSGFGLGSPRFQAAINGPCRSRAPHAWVAPGPVGGTLGGGQ